MQASGFETYILKTEIRSAQIVLQQVKEDLQTMALDHADRDRLTEYNHSLETKLFDLQSKLVEAEVAKPEIPHQPLERDSMAKVNFVKLGSKKFNIDCVEINATCCGVAAADCVALAARMKSGVMRRLKKLLLVRLFSDLFYFC
jgi:hypothetical protein